MGFILGGMAVRSHIETPQIVGVETGNIPHKYVAGIYLGRVRISRIGELVDYSGLSRQTVHNYTTMGLLTESRWTEGGHRLWDESVFERLDTIAELKLQGRSMQYIREYFSTLERT